MGRLAPAAWAPCQPCCSSLGPETLQALRHCGPASYAGFITREELLAHSGSPWVHGGAAECRGA